MELEILTRNLEVKWLDFNQWQNEILTIRNKVFVEEQGFGEFVTASPFDAGGLHLGIVSGAEVVSIVSAYLLERGNEQLKTWGLPDPASHACQITKAMDLPAYRGHRINELIKMSIYRAIHEVVNPSYHIVMIIGVHRKLSMYYARLGFHIANTLETEHGEMKMMILNAPEKIRSSYLMSRKYSEALSARFDLGVPGLYPFLEEVGRLDLVDQNLLKEENLFTAPRSLKDELARISSQARVLFEEQRERLHRELAAAPGGRLLDAGCGPGVFLKMLAKAEPGLELHGLDNSPEMILYAKLARGGVEWAEKSVYATGYPDDHFDFVHAGFLFSHLKNVSAALKEIRRILKPGGVLFVVEFNESTFAGPHVVRRLLRKHSDTYEGPPDVIKHFTRFADRAGLKLKSSHTANIINSGDSGKPEIREGSIRMNSMDVWGTFFSFMGQYPHLERIYDRAKRYYMQKNPTIEFGLQTQIYRRPEVG